MATQEDLNNSINNFIEILQYLKTNISIQRRNDLLIQWAWEIKSDSTRKINHTSAYSILKDQCFDALKKSLNEVSNTLNRRNNLIVESPDISRRAIDQFERYWITLETPRQSEDFPYFKEETNKSLCSIINGFCGKGWEWIVLLILCDKMVTTPDLSSIDFTNQQEGFPIIIDNETLYLWYRPTKKITATTRVKGNPNLTKKLTGVKPDFFLTTTKLEGRWNIGQDSSKVHTLIECKASSFSSPSLYKLWGQARYVNAKRAILLPFSTKVGHDEVHLAAQIKDSHLKISAIATPELVREHTRWNNWIEEFQNALKVD